MKQLVDEDLFARYDRLLLQSSLDLMADVVYCPRQSCGTAVMVEPDTTMGICSACHYAFCTLCKMGYHGLSHCKITAGNVNKISNTVVHHSGFFTFQRKFVSLFPICPVLQMNYGTSEMSTCQPRLKVRSLWSNGLGKGSSKKLWRSPTAEIG